MSKETPGPIASARQRARKFRVTGVVILTLGIVVAGVVYWLGTRSPDLSASPSMAGYDKPVQRQMAMLYGRQGRLIEEWSDDLKQPGTQAFLIVAAAALVAGVCFYFARLSDFDSELADETDSQKG